MVSSAYQRLLLFLPVILIPACASSSPVFHMMYSAYKLNKQVTIYSLDVFLSWFGHSLLFPVQFSLLLLTCMQVSQEGLGLMLQLCMWEPCGHAPLSGASAWRALKWPWYPGLRQGLGAPQTNSWENIWHIRTSLQEKWGDWNSSVLETLLKEMTQVLAVSLWTYLRVQWAVSFSMYGLCRLQMGTTCS